MATYTARQAAESLPDLLNRAVEGEEVIITRTDGEVIRLVAEEPMTEAEREAIRQANMAWLRERRITLDEPVDFTAFIRQMRDEGL